MSLPYTKTEVFSLGDRTFGTELAAVRAAVQAELGNAGMTDAVLEKACELAPLLARACELQR